MLAARGEAPYCEGGVLAGGADQVDDVVDDLSDRRTLATASRAARERRHVGDRARRRSRPSRGMAGGGRAGDDLPLLVARSDSR